MRAGDRATYVGGRQRTRVEVIHAPSTARYGHTGPRVFVVGRSRKSPTLAQDTTAWLNPALLLPAWPSRWWRRTP